MGIFSPTKDSPSPRIALGADNSAESQQEVIQCQQAEEAVVIERSTEDERVYGATDAEGNLRTYKDKYPVMHVVGQTKIVAIINQKGGVGKSTTAINLSAALGEMGKQVLMVDLDPQANSTSGIGVDQNLITKSVYDLITADDEEPLDLRDVIIPDVCKGVDVVPSHIDLAGAELELVSEFARETRLKKVLGAFRGKYDYMFIDCPPSLGLLTINALVAADKVLTPIQCEFYALEGVTKLLKTMNRVKNAMNPSLETLGILLTMYDSRTRLSNEVVQEVRKHFDNLVFETLIPRAVVISEAPSYGMPITQYAPDSKGAQSYIDLAKEVIQRG